MISLRRVVRNTIEKIPQKSVVHGRMPLKNLQRLRSGETAESSRSLLVARFFDPSL